MNRANSSKLLDNGSYRKDKEFSDGKRHTVMTKKYNDPIATTCYFYRRTTRMVGTVWVILITDLSDE